MEPGEILIQNGLQIGTRENYHDDYNIEDELLDILETEDQPEEYEKLTVYPQSPQDHLTMSDDLVHNDNQLIETKDNVENNSKIQNENSRDFQWKSSTQIKSKTKVKLLINGDSNNVNWMNISKPPNYVTLNDIKLILQSKPKKYGMSNEIMYEYCVKTTDKDGDIGFEDIDDENTILPLFEDQIVLKCWTQ